MVRTVFDLAVTGSANLGEDGIRMGAFPKRWSEWVA